MPELDRVPLRIAVDLRALVGEPTGIGVYTLALLRALSRREAARYVGLAHRLPSRGAVGVLSAAGIAIESQPAPLGALWQQLLLPRRLARGDIDLFWSPLFTLPLASSLPAVVTIHDLTPLLYPEAHRRKVRWTILPLLAQSLERARRIVAVSRATADDLCFHFPECRSRLEVVYPGADEEFRPASPDEIAATRRRLGVPDGYLLYVGTLEPRKNLSLLVDAWESLRREEAAVPPLLVAGPYGWGARRLLRRLRTLEGLGLRVLGKLDRPTLVAVMQGARAFVYPSLYEGFGLPVAEAMACAVPTLAARSSSLPEVVGDAGVLFDPGDVESLRRALRSLLRDPVRSAELGARGSERVRALFRWELTAAAMEQIFVDAVRS